MFYKSKITNYLKHYTPQDLIIIFFFSLIPISFFLGNLFINLNIILIDLYFLILCIKNKNWNWLRERTFIFIFLFYLYLIFNSSYSIQNPVGDFFSVQRSLGFLRYIILIFAVENLMFKNKRFELIFAFWSFITIVTLIDILFEFSFGFNLAGNVSPNHFRIVSFFGDELVVGSIILFFGYLTAIFFLINFKNNHKTKIISNIILISIPIIIFLTGERSNSIKSIILFSILIFFIKDYLLIINKAKLFFIFLIIITSSLFLSENMKKNHFAFFERIGRVQSTNIINKLENIQYIAHYDTAIRIFKNYPITGIGSRNFRYECANPRYHNEKLKMNSHRCATHPHQIHFELLSEHGLIGYLFIIIFFLTFLFNNFKIFLLKRNLYHLTTLLYIFVTLIPLLPSGSLFSTFNASLFWLNFALAYSFMVSRDK